MLLTLEEYAEKIGVTFSTVRSAIHRGKITPTKKIGSKWYIDSETEWVSQKKKYEPNEVFHEKSVSYSRIYNVWRMMRQRCYNPNATRYKNYGGRGIGVCEEWKNSSQAFILWALDNGYQEGLQIDRIDTDKDYSPENCVWVTIQQNLKHRDLDKKRNKKQ